MKQHHRNVLLALALMLLVAVLVIPLSRREADAPAPSGTTSAAVAASTKRLHPPAAYTGPTISFLGQSVPAAAEPYLVSAVKCAKIAQAEAEKYPPNTNAGRGLRALTRKL